MAIQHNRYELIHSDGSKSQITANSYRDVKRAVESFRINAIQVQRIFKNGSRGTKQTI